MSRSLTSFSLAGIVFFSAAAVGTANAKECKTSSDCADGFECVFGVRGGSGTGGSTGISGGGAGTGAAVGTACEGPDCPTSSPGVPSPAPDPMPPQPVPTTPPQLVGDAGTPVKGPPPLPPDGGITYPPPADDVPTTGICQVKVLICTSKADCPANLDCVKNTIAVTSACAPNTICDTPLPPTVETGTCKAVCNLDSDCPAPLVCKLQGQVCMGGGSASTDGTVTTTPTTCTGGTKMCSYEPVICSTDGECKDPNYQCAKIQEYQSCTGSAGVGCPKSTSGAEVLCQPVPPEPAVCTPVVVKNCLPKEIKCDAGEACPAGWSCLDLSNFPGASVPGWSTPMPGKACLPDGLILSVKGQASGGSDTSFTGPSPTRGGTGEKGADNGSAGGPVASVGDASPPSVAPVPPADGSEHTAGSDAGSAPATSRVRGGGCALAGTHGSFDSWLTLGLAGLVLGLLRRRR